VLDRCKGKNVLSYRKYDDTARMLSGRSSHAHTTLYDTVDLTISLVYATFFIIILDVTKSGLISKRTDRTRLKGLAFPKDNLGVFMRL